MNKPLEGAIIGFGNIAEKGHWPTYASTPEAAIVAIMDPSAGRQAAAHSLNPGLRVYGSVDDLFKNETLDFIDICTPPASHAGLVLQALENHCHVLCEKPLTLKPSDYSAIKRVLAQRERVVFTVHNWKYAPIFKRAFSLIREGRIGKVWHVEIFTLRDSHCKGTAQFWGEAPSEDWRTNPVMAGGGILVDHGWHSFYLLMNLVGAEPERILAKMQRPADNPQALEEAVQTIVQFPAADGYIHLTWRSPLRRNSVIVQGQKGTLLLDDNRLLLTTFTGEKLEENFDPALSAGSHHADWFQTLWPDFLAEVRGDAVAGENFREAGWCLALTDAAYESSRQNFKEIPVTFPGVRPSFLTISKKAPDPLHPKTLPERAGSS